jgi:transcriptional regulator with XRE-family HTH domain
MDELRRIRKERGLSQQRLAELAKVDKVTIVHIEGDKVSPKVETLEKLATALEAEVADFFPKAQAPLFQESPEQKPAGERRADVKGPDESVWGAPQNRPGPGEQIPESAGQHIHVEIRDDLSNEPARVTITRTAFLDMLRRHGLPEPEAEEVIEELQRKSA